MRRSIMSALTAAAALMAIPASRGQTRYIGGWKQTHNRPHQGKAEMARRRRQIERGQLKVENGLMKAGAQI